MKIGIIGKTVQIRHSPRYCESQVESVTAREDANKLLFVSSQETG